MKTIKSLLLGGLLVITGALCFACGDSSSDGDSSTPPTSVEATTADYKIEYYFEAADGYEVDESKTETKQGTVGKTVTTTAPAFEGYIYEADHKGNILRGKVAADGSLVLKVYYCQDYTGRVVFDTDIGDTFDVIKGEDTPLDITVLVDGEPVTAGVTYSNSYKVISVNDEGVVTAKMRGESDLTVAYKNVSKTFKVTVYDGFIDSEEDWWAIYDHLGYWYKFTSDIVLTENTVAHFTKPAEGENPEVPGYLDNRVFEGVLDGGGHTLTYDSARLFNWVSGNDTVIRNITLNASNGFYWGSTIAYGMDQGARAENVTVNASFNALGCFRAFLTGTGEFWIQLGGDDGVYGNGGMFGMIDNATVENCKVSVDLTALEGQDGFAAANFGGIAYSGSSNAVVKNCTVYSSHEGVSAVVQDKGGLSVRDCTVSLMEKAAYNVEYYLEGEDGFVKSDEHSYTAEGYVGRTVAEQPKSIIGYAYDGANVANVLSGEIGKDAPLTLKLYYVKTDVVFTTETPKAFEVAVGSTKDLAVTVSANGEEITEGIVYKTSNASIATVENGVVTPLKGGTVTVTVEYAGASTSFDVTVWTKLVANESDWWSMYESADALSGYYKLVNDITLTKQSVTFANAETGYQTAYEFRGLIDGDGKTLTYTGAKLFNHLNTGTIKNITLNAGEGYYWGMTIAFHITDATIENVNITAKVSRNNTYQFAGGNFIEAQGAGIIGVWVTRTTIKNCTVDVTLTGDASASYYSAIAYALDTSTVNNVQITSNVEMTLFKTENGTNEITDSAVKVEVKEEEPSAVVEIATEEDWWGIYASEETLAKEYKLVNDITLTKQSTTFSDPDNGYQKAYTFTGVIDGNGKTLTYFGAKLFNSLTGTIKNITLDAGEGYYWGMAIAFHITNATIENVNITAKVSRNNTYQFAGGNFIEAQGAGIIGVWVTSTTIKNCNVNVTLTGDASASYYSGVCYELNNSVLENVQVTSNVEMTLFKSKGGTNTVTNSAATVA